MIRRKGIEKRVKVDNRSWIDPTEKGDVLTRGFECFWISSGGSSAAQDGLPLS